MSLQMRIDQFYKSTNSKQTSNVINANKNSGLKNTHNSINKKKSIKKKRNISLSQDIVQSDTLSNSTIVHSNTNEIDNIDVDEVKILYQSNKKVGNNKLSSYKDKYLKVSSKRANGIKRKLNIINSEVSNNNKMYLEIPQDELGSSQSISKKISNNDIQLRQIMEEELEENSSLSVINLSVLNSNSNISLERKPNEKTKSPCKKEYWVTNSNDSVLASKKSSYSPKVPSGKSLRNIRAKEPIDDEIIMQAIKHMNLAKQSAISPNNFNLEEIYSNNSFNYEYNQIYTKTAMKYELNDITFPVDLKSRILIIIIFTVFSNPINCGYFDINELDFIYSIITLPIEAQMLLVRMLKRKRTWYRKININYPDIASDLKDIFNILVSRSICTFDIKSEDLSNILDLLQVDELRRFCQKMKISPNRRKESSITKLIELSRKKSLFPGMKSPSNALYARIFNMLDYCVRITDKTWNIIDRIVTLLIPNQDPRSSLADIFFMLFDIYQGKVKFPKFPEKYLPIFSSQIHLLNYVEAKSTLSTILELIEKKNWMKVQEYGNLAMDILPNILKVESSRFKNSVLPIHVRRFKPGYIWLKVLSKSIDAFKKNKDKKQVMEILRCLIKQDCHMQSRKGKWYSELALIEMFHHKNIRSSALIIMEALETGSLTQVDKIELIKRGNKILQKKTGVDPSIKIDLNKILDNHIHQMPKFETAFKIIDASLMPSSTAGNKSIWCIESNTQSQSYGSVETLALYHYYEQGFSNGLHCEGALPILLFVTLLWEQIYDMHIPGAFVTLYQYAPEDLFTDQFYENRKEQIDMKLQFVVNHFDSESLGSWMETRFKNFSQYQSIMSSNLLKNSLQLKEIIYCLGVQGVIGICKRLIDNYKLWKAGFPDLIVWNFETKQHKIVEVKGPKDTLSTKQRLWLEYLNQLGLNTEICMVQDQSNVKRLKNQVEDIE